MEIKCPCCKKIGQYDAISKNYALITLIEMLTKEIVPNAPDKIPDILPKIQKAVTKYKKS